MDQATQDDYQRRGIVGIFLLVMPIVSIIAVGIGYALLLWFGLAGRPAEGTVMRITFAGCPDAQPLVAARIEAMGLPDVAFGETLDGFTVDTRMPTRDDVAEALPATLAQRGTFAILRLTEDGSLDPSTPPIATEANIVEASMSLSFLDTPRARVQLDEASAEALKTWMSEHPAEGLSLQVEGRQVTTRANMPPEAAGELYLDLDHATDLDRMDFAASAAIVLEHGPLPCDLEVAEVRRL
jgi:hypothetical protein